MIDRRHVLTLGGADVALSARRPRDRVLVVYLDRAGRPGDYPRFAEVMPHQLKGAIGVHMAEIKARIARLPFSFFASDDDAAGTATGDAGSPKAGTGGAAATPASPGRFLEMSLPPNDR